MPITGTPSSSSAGSSAGAPSAYTDAGPPESTIPRGRRATICSTRDVVGEQLAEDPAVAHPAGDQLRVLPAVVEHDHRLGSLGPRRELRSGAPPTGPAPGGRSVSVAGLGEGARRGGRLTH